MSAAGSNPFGGAVTDSIIAAARAAGAELIRCDPGADPALVLDCARRLATQKVDGWIAVQPGDLGEALCGAGPQGVPLITVAAASLACRTAGVGADDRHAGFLVGAALGGAARSGGDCVYGAFVVAGGGAADITDTRRIDGVRAGFASQCPGPIRNELVLDPGTQDGAHAAFATALSTYADNAPVLVAAMNDGAALGVVTAVPATRTGRVTVAAIGADQRSRCEIVANPAWIGDAALFPDRYGEVVVPVVLDALAGRPVPPSIYVGSAFLTAATLGGFYDLSDCPGR